MSDQKAIGDGPDLEGPDLHEQCTAEVTQVGDGLAVTLPREILAELNVQPGDKLRFTRSPDGYHLTRPASEFERQMSKAREIMHERRDLLRELAK